MTDRAVQRRHVMAGLGAAIGAASASRVLASPDISANIEQRLAQLQKDSRIPRLDALVVAKGQKQVFEYYGRGMDEDIVRDTSRFVVFGPEVLHDIRSVSKSVVSLTYGVALAQGKVPPPEAKLYDQFPEYADLATEPGREKITIRHVLNMTLGLEWDELTVPYGDDLRNSEMAMEAAPDRFRFILGLPIAGEPGVKWTYCGAATAILGRLIAKGTGEKLPAYARLVLFEPMGFGPSEWAICADGEPRAASGCRLLPCDMLKVGQLALAGGTWQGKQIVPADWVKRITTPTIKIEGARSYGYHWYLGALPSGAEWFGGIGWGGQRLFVVPRLELVVALYFGNYNLTGGEQIRIGNTVILEAVLPAFT